MQSKKAISKNDMAFFYIFKTKNHQQNTPEALAELTKQNHNNRRSLLEWARISNPLSGILCTKVMENTQKPHLILPQKKRNDLFLEF
jgi:hypothetical protein